MSDLHVYNGLRGLREWNVAAQMLRDFLEERVGAEDSEQAAMKEIKRRLDACISWADAKRYLQACSNLQVPNANTPITPPAPERRLWEAYVRDARRHLIEQRAIERGVIQQAKQELAQVRADHRIATARLRNLHLSYAESRARRSVVKAEAAQKELAILPQMRAARQRLAEQDRADPTRNRCRKWLVERAEAGGLEAVWELRRQRIERARRPRQREAIPAGFTIRMAVAVLDNVDGLRYQVRQNGDVSYFSANGVEIMRDTREAIYVLQEADDTVRFALLLAIKRFGNGRFDPMGDDEFNARVVRLAAELNVGV